ncbi:MAG: hypothetical protein MK132_20950 [Lentisphaerales bacterium]|nr:hypothetical protein [Lentisphaerales bacterium]
MNLAYASFDFAFVDDSNADYMLAEQSTSGSFTFEVINVQASVLFWTSANDNDISAKVLRKAHRKRFFYNLPAI